MSTQNNAQIREPTGSPQTPRGGESSAHHPSPNDVLGGSAPGLATTGATTSSVDNAQIRETTFEMPDLTFRHPRISELSRLQPGWDSYGGEPPTQAALTTADAVTFIPCGDGGMQIDLHYGGQEIEVYISPVGHIRGIAADL